MASFVSDMQSISFDLLWCNYRWRFLYSSCRCFSFTLGNSELDGFDQFLVEMLKNYRCTLFQGRFLKEAGTQDAAKYSGAAHLRSVNLFCPKKEFSTKDQAQFLSPKSLFPVTEASVTSWSAVSEKETAISLEKHLLLKKRDKGNALSCFTSEFSFNFFRHAELRKRYFEIL